MKIPLTVVTLSAVFSLAGCTPSKPEAPKAVPAVQLSKKLTEADLALVALTPEAERRLGVETVAVVWQKTDRSRSYGGELILPLGRASAAAGAGDGPGNSVYSLLPSLTPAELIRTAEMQVDADGQVAAARVQVEALQIALKRAEELIASKAGIGRSVEEAKTQVRLAEVALRTAQERRALLGAPVFDAVQRRALWIRVSIYVGELSQLKPDAPAAVGLLGARESSMTATPVPVPFSATANPLISDLFYELKSAEASLRPGLKVMLSIPLLGDEESLVVPAAAMLYDIHGNTWVYENVGPQTYTRRRVEVRRVAAQQAVLGRGPPAGAKIVTAGAAELFGTEFGAGK